VLIDTTLDDIKEIDLDIDPDKNEIFKILDGPATFIGQWPDSDVVIMKCRDSVRTMYKNQNNLGAPFDKEVVNGRILLVRMDHNADHKDFTLKEYLESTRYHQAPPQNNA
jgi:hypothetical protein